MAPAFRARTAEATSARRRCRGAGPPGAPSGLRRRRPAGSVRGRHTSPRPRAAAVPGGAPPFAGRFTKSECEPRPTTIGAAYRAVPPCDYRVQPVMCGPRGLRGAPDHLFHNNGDGTVHRGQRAQAGVADTGELYGFGVAFLDFDDDGRLDLFVANDSGPQLPLPQQGRRHVQGRQRYPSGAALNETGPRAGHMGVAVGDYDQRRPRRPAHHELRRRLRRRSTTTAARPVHRRDVLTRASAMLSVTLPGLGDALSSTTTTTAGSTCSWPTATSIRSCDRLRLERLLPPAGAAVPQPQGSSWRSAGRQEARA